MSKLIVCNHIHWLASRFYYSWAVAR